MNQLSTTDLNRVTIDLDSFVGRAFALGREYDQLPAGLEETLLAYLRAQSLGFAQRYRSGIALNRERIGIAIKQALICVDLALEEKAKGDLNTAVEILAQRDFEGLRRRGWEIAFMRLEEMQRETASLITHAMVVFLQEMLPKIQVWSGLVPESWTGINAEEEEIQLDPRKEHSEFKEFLAQFYFLRSLPDEAQQGLLEYYPKGGPFAGVLRHMIAALSLGLERLVFSEAELEEFTHRCFTGTRIQPKIKGQVLTLLERHLEQHLAEEWARDFIRVAVQEEIAVLETAEWEGRLGLFMNSKKEKNKPEY